MLEQELDKIHNFQRTKVRHEHYTPFAPARSQSPARRPTSSPAA